MAVVTGASGVDIRRLLIVPMNASLDSTPFGRRNADVELRRVLAFPPAGTLDPSRPTVIILDRALLATVGGDLERLTHVADLAALIGRGDNGEIEPPPDFPCDLLTSYLPGDAPAGAIAAQWRGALRHAVAMVAGRTARQLEQQRQREMQELSRVGVALSTERNLMALLEMILTQSRRITQSDAGSIYLVDRDGPDGAAPSALRFKLAQNHSLPHLVLSEFTVPLDHSSLAGYAAVTGQPLAIADVYFLEDGVTYRQNRTFDESIGYRTKSALVFPLRSHRDEVIGVLQLINRKRSPETVLVSPAVTAREVISYDDRAIELVSALASQAAVAIENSRLYGDIERLFEGFVTAAVTTIEARDPTTFGHSGRVASMSVALAEAVDRADHGRLRDIRFTREQLRELRYAGLLHDFGKVGVRERVLVKEKKLYPADLEIIRHRFRLLVQQAELDFERRRAAHLFEHGRTGYAEAARQLEGELRRQRIEIERFHQAVLQANEPTLVPQEATDDLRRIAKLHFIDLNGDEQPLLTDDEIRLLSIAQGNLDDAERREIESHVTLTFRFLQQIPWTRELRGIPEIAYGHHEKLDGRGYPRRAKGDEIPVQTRMMTIADIFDALTATDRPYKHAVPHARALDMLDEEARGGMLDRELLCVFVDARIYEAAMRDGARG
ncbi:MAG: HD family phosphohydrolase [Gemmatimonadaceae bacterium]